MQIKDKFVQYIEGLLIQEDKKVIDNHLAECIECRKEFTTMMEIRDRLILSSRQNRSTDLENKVFDRIVCEQNKRLNKTFKPNQWLENWRSIMKNRITRLSTVTALVFAVIIGITIFRKSEPVATAQDILSEAVEAASGLNSVHMMVKMRTLPKDNFGLIGLDYDFVPIEMWKRIDNSTLQWRIEKTGRILVMDGQTTTMLIGSNRASRVNEAWPLGCYDSWMGLLLDVQGLLDNELKQAKDNPDRQVRLVHEEINGKDKIILEVDVQANIPEEDYLRNKFLFLSDTLKVYQFDSETKLLEDLKIYVIDEGQEVLVFEVTDTEYNTDIDDSIFILNLPDDVIRSKETQLLPDNDKYSKMTPKEVAAAFFNAASKGDWEEFIKFWPASDIDQELKNIMVDLEVISIGEPFQSEAGYIGWFVPYKIRFKNGELYENNLALRNDNDAKRYIYDGGF